MTSFTIVSCSNCAVEVAPRSWSKRLNPTSSRKLTLCAGLLAQVGDVDECFRRKKSNSYKKFSAKFGAFHQPWRKPFVSWRLKPQSEAWTFSAIFRKPERTCRPAGGKPSRGVIRVGAGGGKMAGQEIEEIQRSLMGSISPIENSSMQNSKSSARIRLNSTRSLSRVFKRDHGQFSISDRSLVLAPIGFKISA